MAEPMYRQIADSLRVQIEGGVLAPGSQLPTELELRERYDASRTTIREAIKMLAARGLVHTRPGQGTFVVEKIEQFIVHLGAQPDRSVGGESVGIREGGSRFESSTPRVEVQRAVDLARRGLQLGEDTQVVSRHQQRFIDSVPWSLQTSFYPMSHVQRGATLLLVADDIAAGTDQYLSETLGLRPAGWTDAVSVRAPDGLETAFFDLPPDGRVAVFEIVRTVYAQSGTPLRVTVTVYPADRNKFVVTVGDVATPAGSAAERLTSAEHMRSEDRAAAAVALER